MAYASSTEFTARYATRLTDSELSSHFLPFASSRLEGLLAPYFTVPFSVNNLVAKDLTIDLAYLLILQRSKEAKDYQALQAQLETRITALARGTEAMLTTSGEAIFGQAAHGDVWSNTSQGAPIFTLDTSSWGSGQ